MISVIFRRLPIALAITIAIAIPNTIAIAIGIATATTTATNATTTITTNATIHSLVEWPPCCNYVMAAHGRGGHHPRVASDTAPLTIARSV